MNIALCCCNWDIKGIEKLPYHMHNNRWVIKRNRDGELLELFMYYWVESNGYEVIEKEEIVTIPVDWKQLARERV